jgi:hypothetical protein
MEACGDRERYRRALMVPGPMLTAVQAARLAVPASRIEGLVAYRTVAAARPPGATLVPVV